MYDPTSPCVVSLSPRPGQPFSAATEDRSSEKEKRGESECSDGRSQRGPFNPSAGKLRDEGEGGDDEEEEEELNSARGLSPRLKNRGDSSPQSTQGSDRVFSIGGSSTHNSSYYQQSAQQNSII
jgi:hypothetical protein